MTNAIENNYSEKERQRLGSWRKGADVKILIWWVWKGLPEKINLRKI